MKKVKGKREKIQSIIVVERDPSLDHIQDRKKREDHIVDLIQGVQMIEKEKESIKKKKRRSINTQDLEVIQADQAHQMIIIEGEDQIHTAKRRRIKRRKEIIANQEVKKENQHKLINIWKKSDKCRQQVLQQALNLIMPQDQFRTKHHLVRIFQHSEEVMNMMKVQKRISLKLPMKNLKIMIRQKSNKLMK